MIGLPSGTRIWLAAGLTAMTMATSGPTRSNWSASWIWVSHWRRQCASPVQTPAHQRTLVVHRDMRNSLKQSVTHSTRNTSPCLITVVGNSIPVSLTRCKLRNAWTASASDFRRRQVRYLQSYYFLPLRLRSSSSLRPRCVSAWRWRSSKRALAAS